MIKLKGFKDLAKTLDKLETNVSRKITRKGTAKMAQVVRKEIRKQAPKGKTGQLKKNIKYKIKKEAKGGFTAYVGAYGKAYYAAFIEKGTKRHSIKPKGKRKVLSIGGQVASEVIHPGVKARPFIEPAFKSSKNEAVKQAGIKIMQEIRKVL